MNASTRQRIGMVLFACTALLAGCSRKADEGTTAVQPPQGVLLAYVWDCDDGTSLTMKNLLREKAIVLDLHEGPRRLPQVVSASGAKYDDGSVSFWTRGDTAMFERKGSAIVNCRDNRARSLVADARARGVAFRGQGNEPGWILEISLPGTIVLNTNYGQERHEFQGATVTGDPASGAEYRAVKGDAQIGVAEEQRPWLEPAFGHRHRLSFPQAWEPNYVGAGLRGGVGGSIAAAVVANLPPSLNESGVTFTIPMIRVRAAVSPKPFTACR